MMRLRKHRASAYCAAGPFLVAAGLVILALLAPVTGMIGPASNTFFMSGAAVIALGLLVGVISLVAMLQGTMWVRLMIAVAYIPTVLFSLLLIGA